MANLNYSKVIYSLLNVTGINDFVNGRSFPVNIPQGEAFPAIVYRKSIEPTHTKLTASKLDIITIELMVLADSIDLCDEIAQVIRMALDWASDQEVSGIKLRGITFESQGDELYDDIASIYGLTLRYRMRISR